MSRACWSIVFSLLLVARLSAAAPTFATAGACVRDAGGHVDVAATVDALAALGATDYLYDLPADSDAWARLPAFADAAMKRGIAVDVYLAPWSQARKGGKDRQDGPCGTDYVAWCEAIATVARDHPAIRGVVMDDFYANVRPERFTPELLAEMRKRLAAGARPLAFRPVLYFDEPLDAILGTFARFFGDGVILCYAHSPREVDVASAALRDRPRGAQLFTELPKKRKLKPGQGTFAMARLTREQAGHAARLTFYADDRNGVAKRGKHWLVARVDGRDVWRRELTDGDDGAVRIDLPRRLRAGATIELGVIADEPAEDVEVRIAFDDIRVRDDRGEPLDNVEWADDVDDGIQFTISPQSAGGTRKPIAMTLLVAGAPFEHEKVFGTPGTPKAIAGKLAEALAWAHDGKADGVIAWALPLDDKAMTKAVREAVGTRRE